MLFQKPSCDFMIVGLGNPGQKYAETRHNVGWQTLELLAQQLGVRTNKIRFQSTYCIANADGLKLLLLKPQTYMNLSGEAVRAAQSYFHLPPERTIVIFDDISLPVGRIRVRGDGSAGGHNGIKSIIAETGSQDFPRVKIGVGAKPHPDYDLADWVLSSFSASEKKLLQPAMEHARDAALCIAKQGVAQAANAFNGK